MKIPIELDCILDLSSYVVKPSSSTYTALKILNSAKHKFLIVVDDKEDGKLLGVITDGDIRRALVNSHSLELPIYETMNRNILTCTEDDNNEYIAHLLTSNEYKFLPLVDNHGIPKCVYLIKNKVVSEKIRTPVVIMAGGLGKRLRPYTANIPKPMLLVKGRPILEHIIIKYIQYGFTDIYISVNYLKETIINHFDDGSRWGISIKYLEESEPLGTAGSLSLIKEDFQSPFIVCNGDVLCKYNPIALIKYHEEKGAVCTILSRDYAHKIQYGVLNIKNDLLQNIIEKPTYTYQVNTGIYIFKPEVLRDPIINQRIDMNSLIDHFIDNKDPVGVLNYDNYWLDVGFESSLIEANDTWSTVDE